MLEDEREEVVRVEDELHAESLLTTGCWQGSSMYAYPIHHSKRNQAGNTTMDE